MKKLLLTFLTIIPYIIVAQEYTYIDFSNTNITSGNWNNVNSSTVSQTGISVSLINSVGTNTGAILSVTDTFNQVNENGTTSPTTTIFPSSATRDSFFGNFTTFNGVIETSGGMEITGLDPSKYYTFKIFASRTGVTDNRETQYTITGNTTISATLNASNNVGDTANIYNIQPDTTGKLTLSVTKGANNNNSSGFFYLGAIQMIKTSLPYSDITNPTLTLVYPNGGEIWHASSTPYISWNSQDLTENVTIEYSLDNGTTWSFLTSVAANVKKYVWTIPYVTSNQCKVRITSGVLNDTSENTFSIIPNTDKRFKIVVLGSSTAAGTGPSSVENAWVWMYTDYLKQHDTRFDVTNLAVGGYTTYKILPTGTSVPSGVTIDTDRNVTKAIALHADGIIVNMPSNDANMGYTADTQMANFHLVVDTAAAANIPTWVCTVQPRNFGTGTAAQNIQNEMVIRIPQDFPDTYIDFWTTLANADGSVNPLYNAGDGVHLNDAGHLILLDRVINRNLHTYVATHDNNLSDVMATAKKYLVDFNFSDTAHLTSGNWNNFYNPNSGSLTNLIDDLGNTSSINIAVTDNFAGSNEIGTSLPSGANTFPLTATKDAFYGGNSNPTGGFTISGLNPDKLYSFELFASRADVSGENLETLFTLTGTNVVNATLNATANTSNTCLAVDIDPDTNNSIVLSVAKGTNNNNSDGYFCINSLKITEKNPVFPDVLLDAEDGTTNRLTVLNPMANGPGQSTADFQVVDNPLVSGINTSSKVVKFTRRTTGSDTEAWGGFWCNAIDPDPDVTVNKYVHVKILKNRTSQQKFKLENGTAGNQETFGINTYTTVGQWQDIVFDFSSKTGTYTTVALMPDWQDPLVEGAVEIIYFDDIIINSNPNPQTLGISENTIENKILIYPNPASKEISINSEIELTSVEVYNINGALINKHYINTTSDLKLNISKLTSGIYFFKFVSVNGLTETKKIIISNQ